MDEVKGKLSPALLHAACCHEHRYSIPGMPPAGLRSGSWCQVCWATAATPPGWSETWPAENYQPPIV